MRRLILAASIALIGQHAWAGPRDWPPVPTGIRAAAHDPCGMVSNNAHVYLSERALSDRCKAMRGKLLSTPGDVDLRARCDHAAHALTGAKSCIPSDDATKSG